MPKVVLILLWASILLSPPVQTIEKFGPIIGKGDVQVLEVRGVVPCKKLLKNLDGRLMCTCGSRIFVKVRPNVLKRVKAR